MSRADGQGARAPRSRWAIAALICGVGFWCPPLSIAGIFLGWRGLVDVRATGKRGTAMARTAIVLGIAGVLIWGYVGYWLNVNVRQFIINGPGPAIRAAQQGSTTALIEHFGLVPTAENMEAAEAFTASLTDRYGRLLSVDRSGGDHQRQIPPGDRHRPIVAYLLTFERATVEAEAELQVFSDDGTGLVGQANVLYVYDEDRADLVYPPGAVLPPRDESGG